MTIEERFEDMERELGRQKRRIRWLLGAIMLLIGGLVTAGVFKTIVTPVQAQGTAITKEIRAEAFIVYDENGKPRAMLGTTKDGSGLLLYAENGIPCAGLSVDEDGPSLSLYDENSKLRVGLGTTTNSSGLSLYDENSKPRVGLDTTKNGPTLRLFDENGNSRFMAGKITMISPNGKSIEYPESSLLLFGPDGKVIWSAIK